MMKTLKSVKFWLIISLCFNLLFLGAILGGAGRAHKMRDARVGAPPNEIVAIFRALPKEQRQALREDMQQRVPSENRANIAEMADLIAAEPFNEAALVSFFAQNRARNDAQVERAQAVLIEQISQMSEAQRQEMAEDLRHMPRRGDGGDGHKGHKPPHDGRKLKGNPTPQ